MITSQKWEGAVLQLHDNTFQDWQHGSDVQKDQDDWLPEERMIIVEDEWNKDLNSNKVTCIMTSQWKLPVEQSVNA